MVVVSASTSSPSSHFSSPRRALHDALVSQHAYVVGSTVSLSSRSHADSNSKRLGSITAAAAASSDETDGNKPSSSSSTSTTTAVPSIPQDTIPATPATAKEWELDFGSRPVLDERGKKWWELLIVAKSSDGPKDEAPWVFSRWLPNTKINSAQVSGDASSGSRSQTKEENGGLPPRRIAKKLSAKQRAAALFATRHQNAVFVLLRFLSALSFPPSPSPSLSKKKQLKAAITEIASQPGATAPASVRFFRGAMQNIISRALTEAGIKPLPSRRCFALYDELERRAAEVYPAMPGFSATAPPPFGALDATAFGGGAGGGGAPAQLPDALRGEAWAFVQLPLEELAPELDAARRGDVFGAVFEVDAEKDKSLPSAGTPIPGKREESLFSLSLGRGREIKEKREPRREKR
jgi:hypothetical protein